MPKLFFDFIKKIIVTFLKLFFLQPDANFQLSSQSKKKRVKYIRFSKLDKKNVQK